MTKFDYKKYSLENLENWLHDAISSDDATPQEIYDTIVKVVRENYEYHKQYADQSNELLSLLKGHRPVNFDDCVDKEDRVNRWVVPVELDGLSGECYIQLPDDLLERAGLKEGDQVEWIGRGDGSFELRKV